MRTMDSSRTRPIGGTSRFAFVTLLMLNDSYLAGALLLAQALRRQRIDADLVCMVTAEITPPARTALEVLFDRVVEVEKIRVPHHHSQKRPYLPYVFTKLHALRMGADGDLGLGYGKVVFLDADVLPLRHYELLLAMTPPAGVINECKSHLCAWDAAGRYVVPPEVDRTGKWRWHQVYERTCPHGEPIPRAITDRVKGDPANMGVNGSLLVLEPSAEEFEAIMADLCRPAVRRLVSEVLDWPEMQYLTIRWSGRWRSVDLRFSGFKGYPRLSLLYGTHFAGFKPWRFSREKAMQCYGRYEDFQYWFREYISMLRSYPRLRRVEPLRRLLCQTQRVCGAVGPVTDLTNPSTSGVEGNQRQQGIEAQPHPLRQSATGSPDQGLPEYRRNTLKEADHLRGDQMRKVGEDLGLRYAPLALLTQSTL